MIFGSIFSPPLGHCFFKATRGFQLLVLPYQLLLLLLTLLQEEWLLACFHSLFLLRLQDIESS